MKSRRQMMVLCLWVVVLIGQFCRDVIGCQDLKVAAIGRSCCVTVAFDPSIVC